MADLVKSIYPFDFSVLQLQSCQNATVSSPDFPHLGRLFPPKRSHFVHILPYLFPVVKARKHTLKYSSNHRHHSWFGIGALPMKKPVYRGFFLVGLLCMWNFRGIPTIKHSPRNCFFPLKTPKRPAAYQQPGSWARVSKSLEAGRGCHVD